MGQIIIASSVSDKNGNYRIEFKEDIVDISLKSFDAYTKELYLDSVHFKSSIKKGGRNNADIYLSHGKNVLIIKPDSLSQPNLFDYRIIIEECYRGHTRTDTIFFRNPLGTINSNPEIYSYMSNRLSLWISRKEIDSGVEDMYYKDLTINSDSTTIYYAKWVK